MIKSTVGMQWHGKEVKIQGVKVVSKSAYETGLVVEGQAKNLCPRDTGRLAGSINTQSANQGTSPTSNAPTIKKPNDNKETLVGTAIDYGPLVEFGTGPHTITVKNASVLTDGKSFFGKTVNHPGTKAQPFLRPALDLAKGKALTIVRDNAKYYFKDYLR